MRPSSPYIACKWINFIKLSHIKKEKGIQGLNLIKQTVKVSPNLHNVTEQRQLFPKLKS